MARGERGRRGRAPGRGLRRGRALRAPCLAPLPADGGIAPRPGHDPVRGVTAEEIGDTWGDPRSGGRRHEGIDIFARRNTPVLSATRGVVTRVGENGLGGRTIAVIGPGGWRHYYAHLQKWAGREEGEWVEAGDVIGFVGTTGNAPKGAPHLHYGVYTREGAVNPYALLTAPPDTAAVDGR